VLGDNFTAGLGDNFTPVHTGRFTSRNRSESASAYPVVGVLQPGHRSVRIRGPHRKWLRTGHLQQPWSGTCPRPSRAGGGSIYGTLAAHCCQGVHWPDLASRRSLRCEHPEEPLCENLVDGHGGRQLWGGFQTGFVGQWVRQTRHSDQFDIVRVRVLRA